MKRRVEPWTVEKLYEDRTGISFPEYQRQANLWSDDKKRLLINSILRDIDIPKLYFNQTKDGNYEVVDGQQRLWAIWEFLDGTYSYDDGKRFAELSPAQQEQIREYELQIVVIEDADDDYLRELFLRLQLGLLLVPGEKLNAATGKMKEFVFKRLAVHKFIVGVKIVERRFAKETLCAQIAINSFARAKTQSFARTRYEDLLLFFQAYEQPLGADFKFFESQTVRIIAVLDGLSRCFGARTAELTSRSYVLSIYLLFEQIGVKIRSAKDRSLFVDFCLTLWTRLRDEMKAGMDRRNRELYAFETMLSSAPGEGYRIEARHEKMVEYYSYFLEAGKIKGD